MDGGVGGFVAPFLQPDLDWDFRLPRVASINSSGHKYGLVYPGVGWVVWRSPDALPEDLVFKVNYLGGEMPTFALNFSRPGAQVAAQYYNFLRLGFEGFQQVQQTCQDVAMYLSGEIAGWARSSCSPTAATCRCSRSSCVTGRRATACSTCPSSCAPGAGILPAYTFPANLEHVAVLRMVVRNGFSKDLADSLLGDIKQHVRNLAAHPRSHVPLAPPDERQSFAH